MSLWIDWSKEEIKFNYPSIIIWNCWCLCSQGDNAEQEGDSQSQGSTTWLVDPKESKRTISTKYETTIFWAEPSSSRPGLTLLPPPPPPPSFCVPFRCDYRLPGLDPPLSHTCFPLPFASPSCHHFCLHLKTTWSAAADQQPLACSLFSTSTHFIATSWLDQPSSSCQPSLFQPASHLLPTLYTFLFTVISLSAFSDKTFFLMLFLLC